MRTTKCTGCNSIKQEIAGKPNSQDVIQSDSKSQEIKEKNQFMECDSIQQ